VSDTPETTDRRRSVPPTRPDEPPPGGQATRVVGLIALVGGLVALAVWRPFMAIVVGAIIVMIFLHELGHYLTAKSADMKVTEFFLGFGPRIWSFHKGETEYGVKVLPAGAYVKVIGMHNLEDVDPVDEPRTYRQKPFWRRLSVAVAGSAMHFLIVLVCLYVLLAFTGLPDGRLIPDADRVENLTTSTDWVVGSVQADSAADAAGLEPDDRVVAIDGTEISTFDDLRDEVASRPDEPVELVVERDGEEITLETTLGSRDRRDGEGIEGFLGVGPGLPTVTYGPIEAAGRSVVEFGRLTKLTVVSMTRFFSPSGLSDFFGQATEAGGGDDGDGGEEAAPDESNRVLSIFGAARIGEALTREGLGAFLIFFVTLNLFVGVFNMIPLLPLDGGHVSIAVYEKIRSRPGRPYHADVTKMLPVAYAVLAVLVLVGITALYMDIVNPINLGN
jgi:membrane-associated protease RseP (regulator of RpoE activity)